MSFNKANSYYFLTQCNDHILADVHTSERGVTVTFKHENAKPGNILIIDILRDKGIFRLHVALIENGNYTYDVTSDPIPQEDVQGVVIGTANEVITA